MILHVASVRLYNPIYMTRNNEVGTKQNQTKIQKNRNTLDWNIC